jgi:hypothetical protein
VHFKNVVLCLAVALVCWPVLLLTVGACYTGFSLAPRSTFWHSGLDLGRTAIVLTFAARAFQELHFFILDLLAGSTGLDFRHIAELALRTEVLEDLVR